MSGAALLERLLDVIEFDIVPLTAGGVSGGNKLFGAAILNKADGSLVLAEPNNETENPLWHGEVHCLKRFYEMPRADRPETKDCLFLATPEPCSLCLSAITWTGFDNFYYLFSHEDSRDSFAIRRTSRSSRKSSGSIPAAMPRRTPTGRHMRCPTWQRPCLSRSGAGRWNGSGR